MADTISSEQRELNERCHDAFKKHGFVYPTTYHYLKATFCSCDSCEQFLKDDCRGCEHSVIRAYAVRDCDTIYNLRREILQLKSELTALRLSK